MFAALPDVRSLFDAPSLFWNVLWPSVSAGLVFGAYRLRRRIRFRRFCRAFGSVACEAGNVVLCLPLWRVQDKPRDQTRFRKLGPDGTAYEHFGPDEVLSRDDMEAAMEVASVVDDFTHQPVPPRTDTDRFDYGGKSVIFIASSLVNLRTRAILATLKDDVNFPLEVIPQEETPDHPAKLKIIYRPKGGEPEEFDSAGPAGYAVVVRTPNPQARGGYWYLVFGAHAEGTFAAGKYLRENWRRFAAAAEPTAMVILKMQRDDAATAEVVREYGFK